MQAFAIAKKALAGQRVYFGVIDEDDLGRIAAGYASAWKVWQPANTLPISSSLSRSAAA